MRVAILGAGVIGSAVAYYLAERGIGALVVERVDVACAASGKSGGFLARDWCRGQTQEALAAFSFDLHTDLAASFGDAYGYRRVDTYAVANSARRSLAGSGMRPRPAWINDDCAVLQQLGDTASTAQLHPAQFTQTLLDAALAKGAELRIGTVEKILATGERATGIVVDGEPMDADCIVVAMGPWSLLAAQWLPLPAVYGLKGYSIVLRPHKKPPAAALFLDYEGEDGERHAPELITRADGDVYLCGFSDDSPLPVSPADVQVDDAACAQLNAIAAAVSSDLAEAPALARQACYRPICEDAMPVIGQVAGIAGAYVATGHNCWGMLNAPGTGYALAELIAESRVTALDLQPLDPGRLPHLRLA